MEQLQWIFVTGWHINACSVLPPPHTSTLAVVLSVFFRSSGHSSSLWHMGLWFHRKHCSKVTIAQLFHSPAAKFALQLISLLIPKYPGDECSLWPLLPLLQPGEEEWTEEGNPQRVWGKRGHWEKELGNHRRETGWPDGNGCSPTCRLEEEPPLRPTG